MRLFVFRCTVRRRPDSPGTADRSLFFFGAHAPVMRKHIHLHSLLCVIKLDIRIKPCILFAENCVKYWVETRGFAPEKLHLGLPFYGRGNGAGAAYDKLLAADPDALQKDMVVLDGKEIWYNGRDTLRRKVALAKRCGMGGVMVWEISEDSGEHEKSLLTVLGQAIAPEPD